MNNNPYQTYKQQSVMTMTPGQMLIALYDELIKQLNIAKIGFEDKDIPVINESLKKSRRILHELQSTLNFDYEISNNLNSLYDYFGRVILNANVKKDDSELDAVIQMISDLRDSYFQASKSVHS